MAQSGELEVSGSNTVSIVLTKRPRHIRVYFDNDDDGCQIPCNPQLDELSYELVETVVNLKRVFTLVITYSVSDNRTIFWHVQDSNENEILSCYNRKP